MPKEKRTLLDVIALSERGEYASSEEESNIDSTSLTVRGTKSLEVIPEISPTPSKAGTQSLQRGVSGKQRKHKTMSSHHHLSLGGQHKDKHDKKHRHDGDNKSITSTSSRDSQKHKKKHKFGIRLGKKKSSSSSSSDSSSSSSGSEDEVDGEGKKKKKKSKVKRMASDAKDNIKKIFKRKKKKKKGKKGSGSSGSEDDSSSGGHEKHEKVHTIPEATVVSPAAAANGKAMSDSGSVSPTVAANGKAIGGGGAVLNANAQVEATTITVTIPPARARTKSSTSNSSQSSTSHSSQGSIDTKQAMFNQLSGSSGSVHAKSNASRPDTSSKFEGSGSIEVQPAVTNLQRKESTSSVDSHKSDKSDKSSSSKSSKGSNKSDKSSSSKSSKGSNKSSSSKGSSLHDGKVTGSYDFAPGSDAIMELGGADLDVDMTHAGMAGADYQVDVSGGDQRLELSTPSVPVHDLPSVGVETPSLSDREVDLEIDTTRPDEPEVATVSTNVEVSNLEAVSEESDSQEDGGTINSSVGNAGFGDLHVSTDASTPLISNQCDSDRQQSGPEDDPNANVVLNGDVTGSNDIDKKEDISVNFNGDVDSYGKFTTGDVHVDTNVSVLHRDTDNLIEDGKDTKSPVLTSGEMKKNMANEKKKSGVPWSKKDEAKGEEDGATSCCFCFWV